jgi:hypothetical protein
MPSVPGKGGGRRNEAAAANGKRVGAPPKYVTVRVPIADGKIPVVLMLSPDDALLAQRLMLRDWPGVTRVEELFAYALRRLAATEVP